MQMVLTRINDSLLFNTRALKPAFLSGLGIEEASVTAQQRPVRRLRLFQMTRLMAVIAGWRTPRW